ncbi:MAG: hypothetical protein ACRD4V_00410, partial [Candidatus Acidiferrales bacterium]
GVKVNASNILHSIRALSCLDDQSRWTDPPRTHILVRGQDLAATGACSSGSGLPHLGATSTTEAHETRPTASASSIEQRDPHDENSSADSGSSLTTSRSPALTQEGSLATNAERA